MLKRLFAKRIVVPDAIVSGAVAIEDESIQKIEAAGGVTGESGDLDLGDLWLLPGLVDTHVHVNEPGRSEWEGFESATRAAAAGGITTLVDMPLNSIPATTTADALRAKREAAQGKCHIDVAFWGGVVPGNVDELPRMAAAGVRGFKCFLVPSGVDEFAAASRVDLEAAMPVIARLGLPLLVHAELPGPIDLAGAAITNADPRRYATWLASRPRAAEVEAIRLVVTLAERFRCRVHIVHLATGDALDDLRAAKARGVPVTVETCPHYLTFAAEEIADGATPFKCAPPIRERAERERLWAGLRDGTIDMIATDHSPCPPAMKQLERGDFMAAWGGIASLEVALAVVWTEASARGFTPVDLARWMSAVPARLAGFCARKGAIAPGHDADLVAWNPDAEWTADANALRQRHKLTPYAGRVLKGRVESVWVRGKKAFDAKTDAAAPRGELL